MRKNCRGGGISIFLHKSLYYKRRQNWYKFGSSGLFYHRNLDKLFLFFHFNLNVLDFENNKKVQNFINLMFCYGMISTIKRPHTTIRIMANMATANVIINTDFKTRILKIRVSERFDIMLVFQIGKLNWIWMMNRFCGMVDRRKAFSLMTSRDHCQISSPSRISDTPRVGSEPVQRSGFVEWSCTVVITTSPLRQGGKKCVTNQNKIFLMKLE